MLLRRDSGGERMVLDSETGSGLTIRLSAEGRARSGRNEFEIEFVDPASSTPVMVTDVSVEAVMPAMGSMSQMNEPLVIKKSDKPGRFVVSGKLSMSGTWQIRVRFTGPAGPSQAVLEVNAS
ncbi:MAG TPA: FixH family protein [Thermoanaerobaculia bacterium]|nr:FixH family protein [Thermoanaerobaculia bacterium]